MQVQELELEQAEAWLVQELEQEPALAGHHLDIRQEHFQGQSGIRSCVPVCKSSVRILGCKD